jgi:hydroxymethylglutaryl-CoA lyase
MGLPKSVFIYEVGPREGVQIEDGPISTDDKVSFINAISQTGVNSIEVTSFVSPKWVPQMADADEVLSRINRKPDVSYRAVYLNIKGLERALVHNVKIDGVIALTASSIFSKRNTNKTVEEAIELLPNWITKYQELQIPVDQIALMTAFGCNFEGDISTERVLSVLQQALTKAEVYGEDISKFKLCDTMGWANPEQIKRTIYSIQEKWPEKGIILHLHDTRGLGLANVYAAIQEGVREFESAIGGLGGCPFAAVKGAAGNIATEDLVLMCEEMGIDTGINLDSLVECATMAERIFGHELPGHLSKGGLLSSVRKKQISTL